MNPGKQLVKGSALAWVIYPENFTACRIKHPETEGSFLSDLAGLSLCTGIIFAIFQSAGDTAPFQNKGQAEAKAGKQEGLKEYLLLHSLPWLCLPLAIKQHLY